MESAPSVLWVQFYLECGLLPVALGNETGLHVPIRCTYEQSGIPACHEPSCTRELDQNRKPVPFWIDAELPSLLWQGRGGLLFLDPVGVAVFVGDKFAILCRAVGIVERDGDVGDDDRLGIAHIRAARGGTACAACKGDKNTTADEPFSHDTSFLHVTIPMRNVHCGAGCLEFGSGKGLTTGTAAVTPVRESIRKG